MKQYNIEELKKKTQDELKVIGYEFYQELIRSTQIVQQAEKATILINNLIIEKDKEAINKTKKENEK